MKGAGSAGRPAGGPQARRTGPRRGRQKAEPLPGGRKARAPGNLPRRETMQKLTAATVFAELQGKEIALIGLGVSPGRWQSCWPKRA